MRYENLGEVIYLFATKIAVVAISIAIAVLLFDLVKKLKKRQQREIKKAYPEDAHGVIFGKKGKKLVFSPTEREGSIGVFSATGTGKTRAIILPTLRSWTNGTSYTIDISNGDIYKRCPDMPNKLILEPEDPDTVPYNIFGIIDDLKTVGEKNEALQQMAYLLMPQTINMSDASRFYLLNGRKILTASLITFYHKGMDFIEICQLIVGSGWKGLFKMIGETGNEDALLHIRSLADASDVHNGGSKQSCDAALSLFATNHFVKNIIRRPKDGEIAIEPKMIETSNIFIAVEDPKLELYAPLLNIITALQMQYISNRKITKKSKQALLVLDEFASLGIDTNAILSCLRKYRKHMARLLIATQNLSDISILYGLEVTKAIMANLRFKVLLGGLMEPDSQKYFADLIGYRRVKKKSISKSMNTKTITESEEKEYIIPPAELDRQGKNTAILIYPDNKGYMLLEKNFIENDEEEEETETEDIAEIE